MSLGKLEWLQIASFCCIMQRMPSPIRVSVELFEAARKEAAIMNRSVAGQLEYWAKLGESIEAAGLSVEDVKELFYRGQAASSNREILRSVVQENRGVYEVSEFQLQQAKRARQKVDYQAQKAGLVSSARMSPFANVRMSAKIREVPLDE